MKKINIILLVVFLVALVGVGGYFGFGQFVTTDIADYRGDLYAPNFGYLKCDKSSISREYPSQGYVEFDQAYFSCQSTGYSLTQDCTVTFKIPTEDEADKINSYLCFNVYNIDDGIPASGKCQYIYYAKRFSLLGITGGETIAPGQEVTIPLKSDQFINAVYIEQNILKGLFGGGEYVNKGKYSIDFYPFYIYRYDDTLRSTGSYLANTDDCTVDGNFLRTNSLIENVLGSSATYYNKLDEKAVTTADLNNPDFMRIPERVYPYISRFEKISIPDAVIVDGDKFCKDSKLYPILDVETTTGDYKIVDMGLVPLKTVQCCNTADALAKFGTGYTCNDNQEAVKKEDEPQQVCTKDSDCDYAQGLPAIGKVYYETCVNNLCELDYLEVECTSDYECYPGFCEYDASNPENSKCEELEPVEFCGNKYCEASRGENENSCPADCKPNPPGSDTQWIYFALGGAALVLLFALYMRKQNQGGSGSGSGVLSL